MNVEKHLALENGVADPSCCFKLVVNNQIKTLCMDSDSYKEQCQYYKMRTVVTIKNLCLKAVEGQKRESGGPGGAQKVGGFNPLSPTPAGGFLGDIHVGKYNDIVNM